MAEDWMQVEAVREQVELAGKALARKTYDNYMEITGAMLDRPVLQRIESPLEAIFYAWWQALTWDASDVVTFHLLTQHEVVANGNLYRLDFVVRLGESLYSRRFEEAGRPFPLMAVEVDGHAFHEKTLDQVTYRNQRDRDLQQAGWKVFHYSWSEVVRNGAEAVGGVIDSAMNEWMACDKVASDKWYDDHPEERQKLREQLEAQRKTQT